MTIRDALNFAAKKIKSTSSMLDAEVLLSHVLDKPKEYLLINHDQKLSLRLEKRFKILLSRRLHNWPVAYLTNRKEFYGLDFYVDPNVLIPRPETEGLVELILKELKILNFKLKILDLGTGSGCIIISLAKLVSSLIPHPSPLFFASDISPAALKIAHKNARRHKVKIHFKQSNLLTAWKNQHFDIIIANLPYLAKRTDPSTKLEPTQALIAKNQGLGLIEKLFQQVSPLHPAPSTLFLEIGHDQGVKIKNLASKLLPGYQIKILNDLARRVRYAMLQKKSV